MVMVLKNMVCISMPITMELLTASTAVGVERIQDLSSRLYKAENRLKRVSPSKAKLANELASAKKELCEKDRLLARLRGLIGTGA